MSPEDQPGLDPALAEAVRRAYVRPVDEVTAGRHVSAIVAAASANDEPVARRSRLRRRTWRPALAVGVATLLTPVGLAAAGVSLPAAVERPYRSVGITLPHQAHDAAPAPVTRPATPRGPATAESPRATERPAGRARAEDQARRREQPKTKASDQRGRQDSPRRPGVAADKPRPASRGPASKPNPASSSKPGGAPKQDGAKKKTAPRPRKTARPDGSRRKHPRKSMAPSRADPGPRPLPEYGAGSQKVPPDRPRP